MFFSKSNAWLTSSCGLLTIMAASAVALSSGSTAADSVTQSILTKEHELSEAYANHDVAALRRLLADDYVGIESGGVIQTKSETIKEISSGNDNVSTDVPSDLRVRTYGSAAIVTGKITISGTKKDGPYKLNLLFTDVWANRNGVWQEVNYQGTRVSAVSSKQ